MSPADEQRVREIFREERRKEFEQLMGADQTPASMRLKAGFQTIQALSDKSEVSRGTIRRFETGDSTHATAEALRKVGEAVGNPVGYAAAVERQREKYKAAA